MIADHGPVGQSDDDLPEVVEQTVTVDGNTNTTVQAGRDAHVTIQQPTTQDRAELVRHLAPFLLSMLVLLALGEQIGTIGRIAVLMATVAWMIRVTARDTHLRLVQRIALPAIAVVYTVSLIVFTTLPSLPVPLQVAVPAICWITAAAITLRLTEPEHRPHTTLQYMGVAGIGGGIAGIGFGIALAGFGVTAGGTLFGIAVIGAGIAVIGAGIALILDRYTLFGIAVIGVGITGIGAGIARVLDRDILYGIAMIGGGIAVIGLGIARALDVGTLFRIAMIGGGIAMIGAGIVRVLGGDILFGIAVIGGGVAVIGGGTTAGDALFGIAGIGAGIAVIGFGIAVIGLGISMILAGGTLFGISWVGGGFAVIGGGVAVLVESRSVSGRAYGEGSSGDTGLRK